MVTLTLIGLFGISLTVLVALFCWWAKVEIFPAVILGIGAFVLTMVGSSTDGASSYQKLPHKYFEIVHKDKGGIPFAEFKWDGCVSIIEGRDLETYIQNPKLFVFFVQHQVRSKDGETARFLSYKILPENS